MNVKIITEKIRKTTKIIDDNFQSTINRLKVRKIIKKMSLIKFKTEKKTAVNLSDSSFTS